MNLDVKILGRLVYDSKTAFKIMFELDAILMQVEFCRKNLLTIGELHLKIAGRDCFYVEEKLGLIFIYQVIGDENERAETPFIQISEEEEE